MPEHIALTALCQQKINRKRRNIFLSALPNKIAMQLLFGVRHGILFTEQFEGKIYFSLSRPCGFSMRMTKMRMEGMTNTVKTVETAKPPSMTLPSPR
jgi:hypothetical protein